MVIRRGRGSAATDPQDTPKWREQHARYRQFHDARVQVEFRNASDLKVGDVLAWPDSTAVDVLEVRPSNTRGKTWLRVDLPLPDEGADVPSADRYLVFIDPPTAEPMPTRGRRRGRP